MLTISRQVLKIFSINMFSRLNQNTDLQFITKKYCIVRITLNFLRLNTLIIVFVLVSADDPGLVVNYGKLYVARSRQSEQRFYGTFRCVHIHLCASVQAVRI